MSDENGIDGDGDRKGSTVGTEPAVAPGVVYDPGREARHLLRTVRSGALATLTPDGDPYASLVTVATLPDGSPVLPLSTLAVHTQHLLADPRCSLLLDRAGKGDPLTHPRLTVTARAMRATDEERTAWRTRFLRRHPKAEIYVDFGDFSFWRLDLTGARIIGGFGRIHMLQRCRSPDRSRRRRGSSRRGVAVRRPYECRPSRCPAALCRQVLQGTRSRLAHRRPRPERDRPRERRRELSDWTLQKESSIPRRSGANSFDGWTMPKACPIEVRNRISAPIAQPKRWLFHSAAVFPH